MFPDPSHPPAPGAEKASDLPVARPITGELRPPERRIVLRLGGMPGTPVPETAVHKHRQPKPGKNKVRLARQRRTAPPTRDPFRSENLNQPQLRALVA